MRARARLDTLIGLRFVASLMVFLSHTVNRGVFTSAEANSTLKNVFNEPAIGSVMFFFMLSGFVLTWSAREKDTVGGFLRRRFVSIYPGYLVCWLAGIGVMLVIGQAVTAGATLPSLLLLNAWVPVPQVVAATDPPTWALSCELLFYLCFPWLNAMIARVRPQRLWALAGVLAAGVIVAPLVAQPLPDGQQSPWDALPWLASWFVYALPPVRMLDFVLGMVMARIVMTGRWIGLRLGHAVVILLVGWALSFVLPGLYSWGPPVVIPMALLIAAAAANDTQGRGSLLRTRLFIRMGRISYSRYLVHYLLIEIVFFLLAGRKFGWVEGLVFIVALFAVNEAVSWLLRTTVINPVNRRWLRPRTQMREAVG
ncbi:acyltransferase family protein [Streptomyces botrytidirepellens]|uniref:acyltransferase family protein n=1 Tax=Streptomyces botrytidirepellens TaxID=2486417 RepID=UPI00160D10CE|nr:acyltransferase [Streptomyces botrytidirepellens]